MAIKVDDKGIVMGVDKSTHDSWVLDYKRNETFHISDVIFAFGELFCDDSDLMEPYKTPKEKEDAREILVNELIATMRDRRKNLFKPEKDSNN